MNNKIKNAHELPVTAIILKKRRLAKGYTQLELAELCGLKGVTTISQFERGQRNPRPRVAKQLAEHLGGHYMDYRLDID